ncbi:hypothetical protein [Streptomyces sp. IBSBF 2435]|uniref:hypothetical protein n=1 Tax=Streptomyces sp. IBSBF 2435 TaxID=2903531 RepID=UPI002FDC31FE
MHSAAPLPHLDLTEAQWRLLARLAEGSVPDPSDRSAFVEALALDGLDADLARDDLPTLRWMKLVDLAHGSLTLTDLGAAVHFRALYESSQERLAEIARLADMRAAVAPRLARAVRGLADGSRSLAEALASVDEAT